MRRYKNFLADFFVSRLCHVTDDEDEDDIEDVVGSIVAALGDLSVAHPSVVADRWRDEVVVLCVFVACHELPGKSQSQLYGRQDH